MTVKKYVLNMKEFRVTGEGFELNGKFLRNGDEVDLQENEILKDSIMTGVLCNNATLPDVDSAKIEDEEALSKVTGDPMEVALLVCGRKAGMNRDDLRASMPEAREVAFDPEVMMMATFHELDDGSYKVAVKGSPKAVLDVCTTICTNDGDKQMEKERNKWIKKNSEMAEDGLRVLALATKVVDSPDADPYDDLTFLGLVGLIDPPRDDIRESIQLCQDAGVEVIMVTGDQTPTAKKVGKAVDLVDEGKTVEAARGGKLNDISELSHEEREELLQTRIFSRLSPKQKLDLIALHQENGSVVAMTGDGVNDAPALKKADIGIAMGKHGTQVAHEAADVILKDDAFSTIIAAIKYGRVIFRNIRKFVIYLLSGNAGEILIVGLASLLNAPLPLLPTQILYLNFVADVFPALALGVGEGTNKVMERPPRKQEEPIMAKRHWMAIGGYGILIAITVLASFFIALKKFGFPEEQATTIAFLTLAIARLWHVFNMRDYDSNIFINAVTKNKWVWRALGLCVVLMLCAVYVPFLADVLYIVVPSTQQWGFIFGMSLIPLIVLQILKVLGVDKLGK
jgi:Ca2+-transporting ATPase